MIELGSLALIIVALAAGVKFFIINPYNGVKHIANVVRPNTEKNDKEESKEVLSVVGNQALNFFGFWISCLIVVALSILIVFLHLPYIVNLILGIGAAVFLILSYYYFQNRDY